MVKNEVSVLVLCACLVIANAFMLSNHAMAECDGDGDGKCGTWMNLIVDCCMNAGGFQGYNKNEAGGTPWLEEVSGKQCGERFDWYWALPCSDYQEPCGGPMGYPC